MTIFICGDSTAASYAPERAPITGWGQVLPELLSGVQVVNHAMAGRSTKSFLAEDRFIPVERDMKSGDVLLIQFGHNDMNPLPERHTEPYGDFLDNLNLFIDAAQKRGAVPVLLTPIPIRDWADGKLNDPLGEYPRAVRQHAQRREVPLIDIHALGTAHLLAIGEEASRAMYMHVEPGVYPDYPDGKTDDVHTRRAGALVYARFAADGLRQLHLLEE